MTVDTAISATIRPAADQATAIAEDLLHSVNARVVIDREAQISSGYGGKARAAARAVAERFNADHAGIAMMFVYEEAFGVRDRLHWLLHLRSLDDYATLLASRGNDIRHGVFGGYASDVAGDDWDAMFVAGSVRDRVLQPHRWGMHGSLTDEMAADASVSPIAPGPVPRFDVLPAGAQTAVEPARLVNSATAGVVMRRVTDFQYEFRNEARVFARAIAETVNLNMQGQASVFLYEEDFGPMDRVHWLIHLRSFEDYYLLMGLDARIDPDAPRATYIRDWISPSRGGGSWERMLVQGSVADTSLVPQQWSD